MSAFLSLDLWENQFILPLTSLRRSMNSSNSSMKFPTTTTRARTKLIAVQLFFRFSSAWYLIRKVRPYEEFFGFQAWKLIICDAPSLAELDTLPHTTHTIMCWDFLKTFWLLSLIRAGFCCSFFVSDLVQFNYKIRYKIKNHLVWFNIRLIEFLFNVLLMSYLK